MPPTLITRQHEGDGRRSRALYSPCETYRYLLARDWGQGERLLFVLLNPSTATELRNDPTVERCERRARLMGCAGFCLVNLFAFRATDPRDLRKAADPVGPDNDAVLAQEADKAARVICGWGIHGGFLGRGAVVAAALRARGAGLHHLG
ncbi:MAG: DUF1643 domain-containing protein, partial [Rhodobacteraceae bacterium]|nr:DUF1643 domain-containing protein [Paracoccaceae bacterium]